MLRFCLHPGCSVKVTKGRCPTHAQDVERSRPLFDVRRWYRTAEWFALRRAVFLRDAYTCQDCRHVTPNPHCDHIIPHRGDRAKFFDLHNLQTLCPRCHNRKTGRGA